MSEQKEIQPFTHASFEQFLGEGKLMAAQCRECGKMHLPPRGICPNCHGNSFEWVELDGKGKLVAFTGIRIVNSQMAELSYSRENPNISGIVELTNGVRISAMIINALESEIEIGMDLKFNPQIITDQEHNQIILAFSP